VFNNRRHFLQLIRCESPFLGSAFPQVATIPYNRQTLRRARQSRGLWRINRRSLATITACRGSRICVAATSAFRELWS